MLSGWFLVLCKEIACKDHSVQRYGCMVAYAYRSAIATAFESGRTSPDARSPNCSCLAHIMPSWIGFAEGENTSSCGPWAAHRRSVCRGLEPRSSSTAGTSSSGRGGGVARRELVDCARNGARRRLVGFLCTWLQRASDFQFWLQIEYR